MDPKFCMAHHQQYVCIYVMKLQEKHLWKWEKVKDKRDVRGNYEQSTLHDKIKISLQKASPCENSEC